MGVLYYIKEPFLEVRRTLLCVPLLLFPLIMMVLVRDSIRGFYLSKYFREGEFDAVPQWGAMVLFFILLVISILVLYFLVRRIFRSRPDTDLRSSSSQAE